MENDLGFIPQDNAEAILLAHQSKGKDATALAFSVFNTSQDDYEKKDSKHVFSP